MLRKKLTAVGLGLATTVALVAGMGGSVALANDELAPLDAPAIETPAGIEIAESLSFEEVPETAAPNQIAEAPAEIRQEAPAPLATGIRTISGKINFPAEVPVSQRNSMSYSLFPTPFDSSCVANGPLVLTDATTGAFQIGNLGSCKYELRLRYSDGKGNEVAATDVISIDLRNSNKTDLTLTAKTQGAVWFFLTYKVLSVKDENKPVQVFLKNSKGVETNHTTEGALAGTGPESTWSYGLLSKDGTYTLRILLDNGTSLYYSSSGNGGFTKDAAKATKINVQNFRATKIKDLSVVSWQNGGNNNDGGTPPKSVSFTDVPKGHKFYSDIKWLSDSGITTGVKQSNGSVKFLPKDNVSREAMIAFLYRANGVKNYKPKGKSPFTDVKPGDKFYTQIVWAYENKVTTGTKQPNGTRVFEPKASITREAMAAFMYRQYGKKIKTGATSAKFTDIPANHKFGKEIKWMASNKITTGTKQANGTVVFDPKGATSREATAAFLHRAELKK